MHLPPLLRHYAARHATYARMANAAAIQSIFALPAALIFDAVRAYGYALILR